MITDRSYHRFIFHLLLAILIGIFTPYGCSHNDSSDSDSGEEPLQLWYRDADQDTYGNPDLSLTALNQPLGYVLNNEDCNDSNDGIHPDVTEDCDDDVDNDCDGASDCSDSDCACLTWYRDRDQDGYGDDLSDAVEAITQPPGYVLNNTDCNDENADEFPGQKWYRDADKDGFGIDVEEKIACESSAGYVLDKSDCDDNDGNRYPGATEIANDGRDQNCNGYDLITWFADLDHDGYGNPTSLKTSESTIAGYVTNNSDCDDNDGSRYPGVPEIADDGRDQDCDGYDLITWYADLDHDGYGDSSNSTTSNDKPSGFVTDNTDCNDQVAGIHPGAVEVCDDGVDNDCNAEIDCSTLVPDWREIGHAPLSPFDPSHIDNPIIRNSDISDANSVLVADPFLFYEQGVWFLFFEVFDDDLELGQIALAASDDTIHWEYQGLVLQENWHMSYPFVFKFDGKHYMMPETGDIDEVRIYEARNFPYDWQYVTTVLTGRVFRDASLFRYQDKWWMFVGSGNNKNCYLYFSDDLLSGWIEHPKSPIVVNDLSKARPAGRPLVFDGDRIIRFAQKCDVEYGQRVRAFEVTVLNETNYAERELVESPILYEHGDGFGKDGMHQIDPWWTGEHWVCAVDGKKPWGIGIFISEGILPSE